MIARIWRGLTSEADADAYLDYLKETGLREIRDTEGNRGAYVLRRLVAGRAEFLFISLWESWEAIRRFAGDEPERARYYPEDERYLLEMTPHVDHFEVEVSP